MKRINLNWSDFKTNLINRKRFIQFYTENSYYRIFFVDGQIEFCTSIENEDPKSVDQVDFEDNYMGIANSQLSDTDNAGRDIVRVAASNKGTAYKAHFFDFTSSKLNSLVCKSWMSSMDTSFSTKYYKADGTEITTQADMDLYCIKTVVTFAPMFDYELVSGTVNLHTTPSENVRLWVVGGAPELGNMGVKEFIKNLNLKYISSSETLQTDGRASKYMKKSTMGVPYNTNQLQIVVISDTVGYQCDIMMAFEYFVV